MSERRSIEKAALFSSELHSPPLLDRLEGVSKGLDNERSQRKMLAERVAVLEELLDGVVVRKGLLVPALRYEKPKEKVDDVAW
jgi:hypothetical protein